MAAYKSPLLSRIHGMGLLAAVMLAGCGSGIPLLDPTDPELRQWQRETVQWRHDREQRLQQPHGWLSLVALEFIDDGSTRIGRADDNDIILPDGPAHWGEIIVAGGQARFSAAAGTSVRVDGEVVADAPMLAADAGGEPTRLEAGSVQVHLIERHGGLAVRVRDSQAETRTGFTGLSWFPVNPDWRIEARFERHDPPRTLTIADVQGQVGEQPNPGVAVFTRGDREHRLEAVAAADPDQLWFILADRTSGRETYGLGRFLYADRPDNDVIVLDFNRAYNPPCMFTDYSTCPLPPQSNRLDLRVTAGERTYPGPR